MAVPSSAKVMPASASKSSSEPSSSKSSKSKTQHKDKPKRPLSAYNLFFQHERDRLLRGIQSPFGYSHDANHCTLGRDPSQRANRSKRVRPPPHGKIGFAELARTIGARWKSADKGTREYFDKLAEREKERYRRELEVWRSTKSADDDAGVVVVEGGKQGRQLASPVPVTPNTPQALLPTQFAAPHHGGEQMPSLPPPPPSLGYGEQQQHGHRQPYRHRPPQQAHHHHGSMPPPHLPPYYPPPHDYYGPSAQQQQQSDYPNYPQQGGHSSSGGEGEHEQRHGRTPQHHQREGHHQDYAHAPHPPPEPQHRHHSWHGWNAPPRALQTHRSMSASSAPYGHSYGTNAYPQHVQSSEQRHGAGSAGPQVGDGYRDRPHDKRKARWEPAPPGAADDGTGDAAADPRKSHGVDVDKPQQPQPAAPSSMSAPAPAPIQNPRDMLKFLTEFVCDD